MTYKKFFDLYLVHYNKTDIEIIGKNITSIPIFPNLKELNCGDNKLTKIPKMPLLEFLVCENNKLTQIEVMPKLTDLYCGNNKLTQIEVMPLLKILYCKNNPLTQIPQMPKLEKIQCDADVKIPPLPNKKGGWTKEGLKNLCDNIKTFFKPDKTNFNNNTIIFMLEWVFSSKNLNSYHSYNTFGIERDLQKTVKDKNYVLYRGLTWNIDNKKWLTDFANSFGTHKMYSIGDYLNLKIGSLSSWSTDKEIASGFMKKNFSILLKLTTNSKNVLVDVENFYKILEEFYKTYKDSSQDIFTLQKIETIKKMEVLQRIENFMSSEKEIILKPGSYKLQIEALRNNSLNINSMEEWGKEVSTDDESN